MIFHTDINHSALKIFLDLKNKSTLENNKIVCESFKVVNKLVNSNINIYAILATQEFEEYFINRPLDIPIYIVPKNEILQFTGYNHHKGIMALASKPNDIPLESIGDTLFILNGVSSPENVGSMIRSLRAFNVHSLIVDEKSCSPWVRRCIRVSMGNVFDMNIYHTQNLSITIKELSTSGYQIIGCASDEQGCVPERYKSIQKKAFIIGSEGYGMDEIVRTSCHNFCTIPMLDKVGHLNASVSAAIIAYRLFVD